MSSYEQMIIVGNVGKTPEMRYTPNGKAVTSFSVAVNRPTGKNADGQWQTVTVWYTVTCWERLAERMNEYLNKGARVFVSGKPGIDRNTGAPATWMGKDGQPRAKLELVANDVVIMSPKSNGNPDLDADDSGVVPDAASPAEIEL